MIRFIKEKDYSNFIEYCQLKDEHNDFYITINNERLFLDNYKTAKDVFHSCLKHGDIAIIKEESDSILGILLILGYSDNSDRKYLKILADRKVSEELLRFLFWNHFTEFFVRLKKNNPLVNLLNKYGFNERKQQGFKFQALIGQELLFKYIPATKNRETFYIKEEDKYDN